MNKNLTNQKLPVRTNIIITLDKIQQGQSLATLLDDLLNQTADNDKAFAHQLLLGTLRQWHAISRLYEALVKTPLTDTAIIATLNMGLYELLYMNTPDYATINETLNALKLINKKPLTNQKQSIGLINALLRKVAKDKPKFAKKVAKNHSLPNWLAKQLKQDWGDYYDALGQSLRQAAPIFLRNNATLCSLEQYSELLTFANVPHETIPTGAVADKQNTTAIRLTNNTKITALPKFTNGFVSVQDLHAQLAIAILYENCLKLLQNKEKLTILDACAAPGGKLMQLLELLTVKQQSFAKLSITALDNDPKRLQRLQDNLTRLQLDHHLDNDKITNPLKLLCADATTFKANTPFDVIVLDVPCSATGVIRRHPDIQLLRQANDIANITQLQQQILHNSWQNLAVGGYLLYITCSLLKQENSEQLGDFVAKHKDACVIDFKLHLNNQLKQPIGYQCLPLNSDDGDGFYYGLLQKLDDHQPSV